MARSSFSTRRSQSSVFGSLLGPVLLVAIAGVLGWILLVTVKWLIVTLLIAFGVALIVVPFFVGGRILGAAVGPDRRHRQLQLATAVLLGIALLVLGFVVHRHGWLLIVVPAAVILFGRLAGRFGTRSRGSGALS
jgi:peptidoglycan/LPS O-acetylase OafA/YrhL